MSLFFLVFIATALQAQNTNYKFEYITMQDGLSQSTVNSILQDSTGFLWFATQDGLNRYDGLEFRVFKHNPFDGNTQSQNWVHVMVETEPGVLWLGTWGEGLNRFDTVNRRVTRFKHTPGDNDSLINNNIRALGADSTGTLWVGTKGGLDRLAPGSTTFTHYRHISGDPTSLSHNEVTAIYRDRTGTLWVGTSKGLNRFDSRSGRFHRFHHRPGAPESLSGNSISAITGDRSGNLWVGTRFNGLNRFIPGQNRSQRFKHHPDDPGSLCSNTVSSLLIDRSGSLWVGTGNIETTGNGLSRLTVNEHTIQWEITNYRSKPDGVTGTSNYSPYLSDSSILSIHEDRGGSIWFGTRRWGLDKLSKRKAKFRHYVHKPNTSDSLIDNFVLSFHEDAGGGIWIGTFSGELNYFDRETRRFTHYKTGQRPGSGGDSIWGIFSDSPGILWLCTGKSGINRFNTKTGAVTVFNHDPGDPFSISSNTAVPIIKDSSGLLWIGTWEGGLNLMDRETGKFYHYPITPASPVKDETIISIYEDKQKALWLCTYGKGLVKATKSKGKGDKPVELHFLSYRHDPDDKTSISSDYVFSILETKTGGKTVLWVGTEHGLNRFDRAAGTFTCFSEADGLSNNLIYGIVPAGRDLWLSTNNGLSQFNTRTSAFRNFDTSDGLQGKEFNQGAYLKSRGGEIFFGGVNGINTFFPDRFPRNPNVPPIVVTRFVKFNTPVTFPRAVYAVDRIRLNYQDRFFGFEFAALDFENPAKNRYAYQLEGFNDEWIDLGHKHEITFAGIEPGEYTLRVKGSNNDGLWNEEGTSLVIVIIPPFRQTWWFRVSLLLLISFLVFTWHRSRMKRLSLQLKTEKEMHTLFTKLKISAREQEIIQLILKGKSNKEIEDTLFISLPTVKSHIYRIYKKVGVKSRLELIRFFQQSVQGD